MSDTEWTSQGPDSGVIPNANGDSGNTGDTWTETGAESDGGDRPQNVLEKGGLLYRLKATMDADLAHDDGSPGYVYADTTDNNGAYVKSGATGTGSWTFVVSVSATAARALEAIAAAEAAALSEANAAASAANAAESEANSAASEAAASSSATNAAASETSAANSASTATTQAGLASASATAAAGSANAAAEDALLFTSINETLDTARRFQGVVSSDLDTDDRAKLSFDRLTGAANFDPSAFTLSRFDVRYLARPEVQISTTKGTIFNRAASGSGFDRALVNVNGETKPYVIRTDVGATNWMIDTPSNVIDALPAAGQSNQYGGGAISLLPSLRIVNSVAPCPQHLVMLNDLHGTRGPAGSTYHTGDSTQFIPCLESYDSGGFGETPFTGWGAWLVRYMHLLGDADHLFAARGNAKSGTTIANLVKGTVPYANGMAQLQDMITLAAKSGKTMRVKAWAWCQGESDETAGTDQATYSAALVQLQSDISADVQVLLPGNPVVDLLVQPEPTQESGVGKIPTLAQYRACRGNAHLINIGSMYFVQIIPGQAHRRAISNAISGEYVGKAWYWKYVLGQAKDPCLQPTVDGSSPITRSGSLITLTLDVPVGPIRVDTSLGALAHYGFEYGDDDSSATITSVTLLPDSNQIQIQLSGTPTGANKVLRCARNGPGAIGRPGAWSNICDSDPTPSFAAPQLALVNWLVPFEEAVP